MEAWRRGVCMVGPWSILLFEVMVKDAATFGLHEVSEMAE